MCRWDMLKPRLSANSHGAIDGASERRTMDIGTWGERRVLRKHLGDIVVGSVDIAVFLERGEGSASSVGRGLRCFEGVGLARTLVRTL